MLLTEAPNREDNNSAATTTNQPQRYFLENRDWNWRAFIRSALRVPGVGYPSAFFTRQDFHFRPWVSLTFVLLGRGSNREDKNATATTNQRNHNISWGNRSWNWLAFVNSALRVFFWVVECGPVVSGFRGADRLPLLCRCCAAAGSASCVVLFF